MIIWFVIIKLRRSPKAFRNYQNPIDFFQNTRDGNYNPRAVLKNQNNFNSDIGKIRKINPNLKSKDEISVEQTIKILFDLAGKII